MEGSTYADALDPTYKEWSLKGLIYAGWDATVLRACLQHIGGLTLPEAERADPKKVKEAHEALQALIQALSIHMPAV